MTNTTHQPNNNINHWYQAAVRTAVVLGVFCAIVIGLLVGNYLRARVWNPLQPRQIESLQVELAKQPDNDNIKQQIRQLDLRIRQEYFRGQDFAVQGIYLLLGGIALYLLAWEIARRLRVQLPVPAPDAGRMRWASAAMGRRSVVAMGFVLAGSLVSITMLSRHDTMAEYAKALELLQPVTRQIEREQPSPTTKTPDPPQFIIGKGTLLPQNPRTMTVTNVGGSPDPSLLLPVNLVPLPPFPEAWQQNWPQFRGPHGTGVAVSEAPASWNGKMGEHIRWKTPVPLPGKNSPIVWGDRVFLSGASEKERQVYCFDADSGKLLWKANVSVPGNELAEPPKVMEDTGYAAPTMATDGERVFAIFANGDVAAFDFAGKQLWAKNLGTPESTYGYAASLAVAPTRLFIQYDQGNSADDGLSSLFALNPATGEIVWQAKRPVPNSWSSPILARTAKGDQLITCGNPWVIAYDPGSGSELWRANCLSGDVGPTPTFAGGMIFATTAYANLAAIHPVGRGDVTKTHIAWMASDGLPDTVSPVSNGEIVLLCDSSGMLTCYEASGGKKLWEHSFDDTFRASPVLVGKRIYMIDNKGVTHVLDAGRTFKEIAALPLGEDVDASPAFVGGRVYIRGIEHLYCIGVK